MSSFYHTVLYERLEYWFKAILHKASHYTKFLTGFYKLTANIKIWFLPISCLQYNFVDSYHELNCIQASAGTCWLGCWEPHIMYEVRFCGVFHPTMYNIRQKHHFFLTQTAKKKKGSVRLLYDVWHPDQNPSSPVSQLLLDQSGHMGGTSRTSLDTEVKM